MKYLELINRFWEENRSNRFSTSECVLYFYLLNEGNRKYWQMPFSCSTAIIVAETGLTKSTLTRAREGLKARGLITFTEGVQNSRAPTYHITDVDTTVSTSHETACQTKEETAQTTAATSIIKDKEKDRNKDKNVSMLISITELEKRMTEDVIWQEETISSLVSIGYEPPKDNNLVPYIKLFFGFLKAKNILEKEEGDCRQHFFNKLKKEYLSNSNYGIIQQQRNNRRGNLEVSSAAKENYEAAF